MTTRSGRMTLAALLTLGLGVCAGAEQVEVQSRPADRRVDVLVDGKPFTSYAWPERVSKPILYPIRTARGTIVTRGFPLDTRPGERVDHPHQAGYWFTYGDVDGVDFWGNSEAIPPAERAKMGVIRQREVVAARGRRGRGRARGPGGLGDARRRGRARGGRRASPSARTPLTRAIDRVTTLAAKGKVTFRDTKEGMLGIRVARGSRAARRQARGLHRRDREAHRGARAGQHRRHRPLHEQRGAEGRRGVGHAGPLDGALGARGRRGRRPAAARPPEEPGLPHLLARARLRPLRREPVRPEGLLERQGGGASRSRSRPASRPSSATAWRSCRARSRRRRPRRPGRRSRRSTGSRRLPVALSAGFVGCGNITDTHARAAREAGLGIAAFFGRDPAKAEAMAARFGGRAFARYEDFLAHRPMDLVVIGSPSGAARRAGHRGGGARPARPRREADRRDHRARRLARGRGGDGRREAGSAVPGPAQAGPRPAARLPARRRPRPRAAGLGARQVAPAARVLLGLPLARDEGARRRGRARQPGDPHGRPAAVAARARSPACTP